MNLRNRNRPDSPGGNSILLVDDDPSIRQTIGHVLAGEGYSVWVAADGAEALNIAANRSIDLFVLDLNLPGRDGWSTYESLMANDPMCKVIVITGRPHQQMKAIEAGVDAFMEKPVDPEALLSCIRSLLRETHPQRARRLINAYVNRRQVALANGACL